MLVSIHALDSHISSDLSPVFVSLLWFYHFNNFRWLVQVMNPSVHTSAQFHKLKTFLCSRKLIFTRFYSLTKLQTKLQIFILSPYKDYERLKSKTSTPSSQKSQSVSIRKTNFIIIYVYCKNHGEHRTLCGKIQFLNITWSSGQSFWLLIMRSRVRFSVLRGEFFLEGEDSHGDDGLGSLVEFSFKAPPGTSNSYITIHLIGTT
jgi:hypothetical protein